MASIGKQIQKSLNEGQADAVIDELNEVVGCHVRAARSGGAVGYQRPATVQQPPQMQLSLQTAANQQLPAHATTAKDGHSI